VAAPAALASTATRSGSEVTLSAAPGEANVVASSAQTSDAAPQPQFFVTDRANQRYQDGSPPPDTPAGPGCQAENGLRGALCGPFPVTVFTANLADGDDLAGSPPSGVAGHYDGGSGNDQLHGGNAADVLTGGAGDDILTGLAGTDVLSGGAGKDILKGGTGNDTIDGGPGRDIVQAGPGNDVVTTAGDHAVDVIDCGPGRDRATIDARDRAHNCEKVTRRK
jgi:hypothetical protein